MGEIPGPPPPPLYKTLMCIYSNLVEIRKSIGSSFYPSVGPYLVHKSVDISTKTDVHVCV